MHHRSLERIGRPAPRASLAHLVDGQLESIAAADAIGLGRAIVVGLPGAFTPVCSRQHAPALVSNADQMREAGFDRIICLVSSDPFVTEAWAEIVDPDGLVTFLSDGNLEFARAFGLVTSARHLFLRECSERYLMIFERGLVTTCKVESSLTDYTCTNPAILLIDA